MASKANKELVKDVVCGMTKPQSEMPFKSDFNGKTYYFCTRMDKELFDAHPGGWVKKEGEEK